MCEGTFVGNPPRSRDSFGEVADQIGHHFAADCG
jgi:hypothetical protein